MTSFQLSLSSLLHQRGRTAISITGAAFAVVLIFMQLGFLGSVQNTATLLYDRFEFDILLTSSEYMDMSRPGSIPRTRLAQAHGASGVQEVLPVSLGPGLWRNPTDDPIRGGRLWQIQIVGVEPGRLDLLFPPGEGSVFESEDDLQDKRAALGRLETVLLDRLSRPDFGRADDMPEGTRTDLNGRRVELAGFIRAGTGFSYSGLLLTSEQTFQEYTQLPASEVTFGLIQLAPGTDPEQVVAELRAELPADVRIFTRAGIGEYERNYWVKRTAVGQFFNFGVLLAITVGGIFIYQMMVADIKKKLPEYATLKAMGYRFGFLFRVVLGQALLLALGGYLIGMVASLLLYRVTKALAHLPIWMTGERLLLVFALTVGMCVGSGLLAVRKVKSADPADLF